MRHPSIPLVIVCLLISVGVWAVPVRTQAPQTPAPAAFAADVASVDSIIAALYGVISGPAGQARDWDRFRNLFVQGARLIPAAPRRDGAAPAALSPDDYVQRASESFTKSGFFETEVARTSDGFGAVMHVFSTYESRRAKDDDKPMARGINSIQLVQHGGRWWIVTVMWDQERPDNPIPAKYLKTPAAAPQ